MSSPVQAITRLIDNFITRGEQSHEFQYRFGAAWWGNFVFHVALAVIACIHNWEALSGSTAFSDAVILPTLLLMFAYSALFALVVAVGVPRGSLIRHFLLGVILPLFAYTMASMLLMKFMVPAVSLPYKIGG